MTPGDAPIVLMTVGDPIVRAASQPIWTYFVAPAAVLLSVAASVFVAVLGIRNARLIARQKATLDLIEKVESAEHYRDLNRVFSDLRRGKGFTHLNSPTAANRDQRRAVVDYLNHYEIVAIGLRRHILDEATYRDWMHGAFVRDWNAASAFIQRERWKWDADTRAWTYRDSIWAFYQAVACAWSPDAVALNATWSDPPKAPSGPGDEALPEVSGTPLGLGEPSGTETVENPNR